MIRRIWRALILVSLGAHCATGNVALRERDSNQSTDSGVLRAVVREFVVPDAKSIPRHVRVATFTEGGRPAPIFCDKLEEELLASLVERNANGRVDLPPLEEIDSVTYVDRRDAPSDAGTYFLALPGYSKNGSRSIVRVVWVAGPSAIESSFVTLQKQGTTWSIISVCGDWNA